MIDLTQLITAQQKSAAIFKSAIAQVRTQRQPIIGILDGLQASALSIGNMDRAKAIETAKQGLRDMTKTDLSMCLTPDDCKVVLLTAYKAIAEQLPADARMAFSSALS